MAKQKVLTHIYTKVTNYVIHPKAFNITLRFIDFFDIANSVFVKQTIINQTPSDKDTPPVIYQTWDDGFLVRCLTKKDAIMVQGWYNAMEAS